MAELFNIRHETDLSEYTSTVTDSGDLSQSGAAALAGTSGGMSALIDGTGAIYGERTFSQVTSGTYRFRFYIDPNNLTMAGADTFQVCRILDSSSGRCQVWLRYDGSNYEIRARVQEDDTTWTATNNYDISNAEHYVEVRVVYAASGVASDGTLDLWIDGVLQQQKTGLDIYDTTQPDNGRLGAVSDLNVGTSGTLYLDEFVFRDDGTLIGAYSGNGGGGGGTHGVFGGESINPSIFGSLIVR